MGKQQVVAAMEKHGLIAVLRKIPDELLLETAQALYDGGVRVCEVAFCPDGSVGDEKTAQQIAALSEKFGDIMTVGAGTVLSPEQVETAAKAGARFMVSPDVNEEVIKKTLSLDLVSVPGAFTPTEALAAHRAGADFIKIFPNGGMSPRYIAALKAPLPHLKLLAVGGITQSNAAEFLAAGASGLGISTGIIPEDALSRRDFAEIRRRAAFYSETVKSKKPDKSA